MKEPELMSDIPIFIDGEELVERPRFKTAEEFAAYLVGVSEGRGMLIVLEHPHNDDSNVIGAYIGDETFTPNCPHGCDVRNSKDL